MGGTDDPSNLIELTVEEHAQAHKELFEKYGRWEDELAYKGLSGIMTNEECVREVLSKSGKKGASVLKEKYGEEWWSDVAKKGAAANWKKNKDKIIETLKKNAKKNSELGIGGIPKGKYMWITDGNENLKIRTGSTIPDGWTRGRTKKWKNGFSTEKKEIVTCPHCGKSGGKGGFNRWHFDKCKFISGGKHKGKSESVESKNYGEKA